LQNNTQVVINENNCSFFQNKEEILDVKVSVAQVLKETSNLTMDTMEGNETEKEILISLLFLMVLSGMLAIISNGMVILAHLKSRKRIFERPIVSLAWVDVLTGCVGTPLVCCIYYNKCKFELRIL
jgi:hypothetical protein